MRLVTTLCLLLLTSACALMEKRATPAGRPGVGVMVGATTSRCTVVVVAGKATRVCLPPKRDPKEPQDSTRADTVSRVTVAYRT
jgi:hypothetical protein